MPTGVPPSDLYEFWKSVAAWLGWALTGLLSFFGLRFYNQVQGFQAQIDAVKKELAAKVETVATDVTELKGSLITRDEFNDTIAGLNDDRERRHQDTNGNFRRLEDRLTVATDRQHEESLRVEQRLGDVLAKIAELRLQRRQEGPERRAGY